MVEQYNIIIEQEQNTVVARYERPERDDTMAYQSEAQLEKAFISQLRQQGYEYPKIKDEKALIANLRQQLSILNGYAFSDAEWSRLFDGQIAGENMSIEDKTTIIQKDHILNIKLDNGESKNIKLLDKRNIHNNRLQVINQYVPEGGSHANRYDVTILVNGLPLVHVELKKRGGSIKEAFNQINRYQRESFWAGRALFDYVQIFVISNGTQTKYYSNTTRFAKEAEAEKQHIPKVKKDSNTFEFTSYWSDAKNQILPDLTDFTTTFFAKHTILNVLTKYCVFTCDRNLLVMRPYQIAATEKILLRIQTALYNKWQGSIKAGGYIWHTTGSGKTLTSFKTAQLATKIEGVDKVLFVVDRQDLDYQTMKEYDNFEKDSANSNADSRILLRQLNDPSAKIIITTIQKLSGLLKRKEDKINVLEKNIVMVFDECHRSQFGDMHALIVKKFKKYLLFGFTGTPIFAANANKNNPKHLLTTAQVFGGELDENGNHTRPLHTYTIINAINDKNVLKFKVDYIRTFRAKSDIEDEKVWGIEEDAVLHDPRRIANNVKYILEHFGQKTKRNEHYALSKLINISEVIRKGKSATEQKAKFNVSGFNSILAADSVPSAIAYYKEFKKQQEGLPDAQRLKIATIFTYSANEEENEMGYLVDEDPEGTNMLDASSRDSLEKAIQDYNAMFGTSYDTSGDRFQNYYKDISLRMKNNEIDLLIVVGMYLTGFDAKTLNTLWVDKNLRLHGLLQAYSRTNRILNAVKNCGNIVCFRNLEKATNDCFALFGDENASGIILLRPFKDYYYGYVDAQGKYHHGYKELIEALIEKYPVEGFANVVSDEDKKAFIREFGTILKFRNLLSTFDDFTPEMHLLSEGEMQDYISWYNDLHDEFRPETGGEKQNINDDIEFEMDLVKQVQINIDYILMLVKEFHDTNCQNQEIIIKIKKAITSSPDMRDKKTLIENFVERMSPSEDEDIYGKWKVYVEEQKQKELDEIIESEGLKKEETYKFIEQAYSDGYVTETGVSVTDILPPMPVFGGNNKRAEKKSRVLERLKAYFQKFFNLG